MCSIRCIRLKIIDYEYFPSTASPGRNSIHADESVHLWRRGNILIESDLSAKARTLLEHTRLLQLVKTFEKPKKTVVTQSVGARRWLILVPGDRCDFQKARNVLLPLPMFSSTETVCWNRLDGAFRSDWYITRLPLDGRLCGGRTELNERKTNSHDEWCMENFMVSMFRHVSNRWHTNTNAL